MKNIALAIGLSVLLGIGFYYFKSSNSTGGDSHSHDDGSAHSH